MFKVEDATPPERFDRKKVKRVFTIEATEEDFEHLERILLAADPMTEDRGDERLWKDFTHAFTSACAW